MSWLLQSLLLLLLLLLQSCSVSESACDLQQTSFNVLDTEATAGTHIGVLNTTDSSDSINAADTNTGSVPITVFSNGSMVLTSDLTSTGAFSAVCTNGDSQFVSIVLVDTDNTAPVWQSTPYSVSVSESQSVPYILPINPYATDSDSDSGQKLNYTILPGDNSDYVALQDPDQSKMNLTLIRSLDYESVQKISLTLQVNDYNSTGHRVFQVNASLTITVVNVDDVNPVWVNCTSTDSCYERIITSNLTSGTKIEPKVSAKDGDLHLNAEITYTIVSQSPSNIVNVNNSTGELTLTQSLPTARVYTIVIKATQADNQNRRTDATLKISVIDTGYSPPVFTESPVNVTVSEATASGQPVATVTAFAHLSKTVTYQLLSHTSLFTIHSSTGVVSLSGSLDFESVDFFSLNVSASDGTGVSFASVNVAVTNENEFNPTFTQNSFTFAASRREKGLTLGQVNATDGDRGDSVTYSIANSDYRELFAIGSSSGILTLNSEGSSLPEKSYTFTVTASDGSRTGSADVSVTFASALTGTSTASVSVIAIAVLASVFGVVILAAIVASVVYKCVGRNSDDKKSQLSIDGTFPYENSLGQETPGTSQQDNPIEGINNFMFGDVDPAQAGPFNSERDQAELYVTDSIYANELVDYSSLTNGSIHTFSASGSLVGSQRTLIPRQLHAGSQLQVVQVENAIDADSMVDSSGNLQPRENGRMPGLTVYY